MVQAISNTLIQGLQLARKNYITTTAAIVAAAGCYISGRKTWDHSTYRAIQKGSDEIRGDLETLNQKLATWKTSDHVAHQLVDHLGLVDSEGNVSLKEENRLSSTKIRNANKHKAFQKAADALELLAEKSVEFNGRKAQFLSEKKEEALTWLTDAAEAYGAAWAALGLAKGVNGDAFVNQNAYGNLIKAAQTAIEADGIAIDVIYDQMELVRVARETAGLDEDADLIGLADNDAIEDQFEEAGKIIDGIAEEDKDLTTITDAIDKLANVDAFRAGVDAPNFRAGVHITQNASNQVIALKGENGRGLWEGAALLTGVAVLILALNHGLPVALGRQHRVVQVLRLPS